MNAIFNFDELAKITTTLIIIISAIILKFSYSYLKIDQDRNKFLFKIIITSLCLITTFSANNIILFFLAWVTSNLMLTKIMIYKESWEQAVNSGKKALKNFSTGFICLFLALIILYLETNSFEINKILAANNLNKPNITLATILIAITALTQSSLYPFHKWLLSSLNSPTPVSALMHAGLVNGGGVLLARFSPLLFESPNILLTIFIIGIFSAIIGTLWKLVQSNVKSMLACSTVSQMGFMIAQCGMGLFPAAIAHLFWHAMFKSYLFLSSPNSWQEKRLDLKKPPSVYSFILALICGLVGAIIFADINHIKIQEPNTMLVLVAICFIGASQISLTIIDKSPIKNIVPALIISSMASLVYAISVVFIEDLMPQEMLNPQDLNLWHLIAILILFILWAIRPFWTNCEQKNSLFLKLYVASLNSSQPDSTTITTNRNEYNYR